MTSLSKLLQTEPRAPEMLDAALHEMGFSETTRGQTTTTRALKLIDGLASIDDERAALFGVLDNLLEALSEAADPIRALLNFSRLADAVTGRAEFYCELSTRIALRRRVCELMAWSQSLADVLITEPALLELVRQSPQPVSRAQLRELARAATDGVQANETHTDELAVQTARLDALRRFKRRETLCIALLDMERQTWRDEDDFNLVVQQISDLAQVCVQQALRVLDSEKSHDFAVLAMGKLGARELNYSSDIDLILFTTATMSQCKIWANGLLKALSDSTRAGIIHRTDMRLRPDGKSGPLVTSIGYALSYYESYAAAWEWQALIKARAIAGDAKLARRFRKFTRGVTWARRADDSHLREMLGMKRRMENNARWPGRDQCKAGAGRDPRRRMGGAANADDGRAVALSGARFEHAARAKSVARFRGVNTRRSAAFARRIFVSSSTRTSPAVVGRARSANTAQGRKRARGLARRMGFSSRGAVAARSLHEELGTPSR
jgi:glutamate-ammonia-ligase adenylyltransferase